MTSARRFEQDLPALLDDLYVAGMPDYRDDLVRRTAVIRQRPAWTFPERWLPMDVVARRLPIPAVPWRLIVVTLLILILAAAALLVAVGSQQRVPPPFGPARNGPIAYALNGDILAQDVGVTTPRVLVGGTADDHSPTFSPNGRRLMFVRVTNRGDFLMGANADGTGERQLLDEPLDSPEGAWSPDSRTIAVTNPLNGTRRLLLIHADGAPTEHIDLPGLGPTNVAWRPPDGAELIVRASLGMNQGLYVVDVRTHQFRTLNLPSPLIFGPKWDLGGPAWSQTGGLLAYNSVEAADVPEHGHFRVHVIRSDGSGDLALPPPSNAGIQEAWPAWSPDDHWILVHRWTWQPGGEGWLAVMPADGSQPAHDIGHHFPGGQDTGLVKLWSPDGTRVIVRVDNTQEIFSIDPLTGHEEQLPWTGSDLPDYQRLAP
jgi:Tol biopolymer transport system component